MIFTSAHSKSIKKGQDQAAADPNGKVILCDGIGEYHDSEDAAYITLNNLLKSNGDLLDTIELINKSSAEIKNQDLVGGTTVIAGYFHLTANIPFVRIFQLGNGSVYHVSGDFSDIPESFGENYLPFRFTNLIVPQVDKEGSLLRYISHRSTESELQPFVLDISLTGVHGDILIFFTDGVSSLEDEIITRIKSDEGDSYWRKHTGVVSLLLHALDNWLRSLKCIPATSELDSFISEQLNQLKHQGVFEDDASIGVMLTPQLVNYYLNR